MNQHLAFSTSDSLSLKLYGQRNDIYEKSTSLAERNSLKFLKKSLPIGPKTQPPFRIAKGKARIPGPTFPFKMCKKVWKLFVVCLRYEMSKFLGQCSTEVPYFRFLKLQNKAPTVGVPAVGGFQPEARASWGNLTCRIFWAQFYFLFIFI